MAKADTWRALGKWAAALMGLGLLAYLIHQAGPWVVLSQLRHMGWWFAGVVAVSSTWFMMNTWGWRRVFPRELRPGYLELLRIHLVSEAVSNVTPFMALGGEPLKIFYLQKRLGAGPVLATVVNDNLVHVTSAVMFMVLGLITGMARFRLQGSMVWAMMVAIVVFGLASWGLFAWARRGMLEPLGRVAGRLPWITMDQERLDKAREVDGHIRDFVTERPWDFVACLAAHMGGRLMGAVEAMVVLAGLGHPVDLGTAIFVVAVIHVLVNLLFSVVPSQLGFQEGAAYLLFGLIGLDQASAVSLALVRRVRGFFWIGVGLALMALGRSRGRE